MIREMDFAEILTVEKILADDRFHAAGPLPDGHRVAMERFECDGLGYSRAVCMCGWLGPAHRDSDHDRR